jgi:di/tricarboxylate transporter
MVLPRLSCSLTAALRLLPQIATTSIAPKAYLYAIMLAASSDFSTPIGYQTNLMVQGVGGYKFLDYTKFGVPLQIICATCYTAICYLAFG